MKLLIIQLAIDSEDYHFEYIAIATISCNVDGFWLRGQYGHAQ